MASKRYGINRDELLQVSRVLDEVIGQPRTLTTEAALSFCATVIRAASQPTPAPATAASSAAPPAATEGASKTEHPPAPPIRAHSHDAAVKAAATRKANKAKAARNGKLDGAGQQEPAASVENDQTE
jgi:hypothetical protein